MDTMLSKALREFTIGPLNQLIVNLGGQDGDQWEKELKKFLRKEPCWSNGQIVQVPTTKLRTDLLELVGTTKVSATTSKFVAKDKFVINTKCNDLVKINYLGDNFTEWFLSGNGKTENSINKQTLRYAKLRKASFDAPIIAELGGEEKSETTLSEIFSLMKKQRNGESGALLNNGYANIFYIQDQNGALRAVSVRWGDDGWDVDAFSVGDPSRWRDGYQVFSRNSVLEYSGTSSILAKA